MEMNGARLNNHRMTEAQTEEDSGEYRIPTLTNIPRMSRESLICSGLEEEGLPSESITEATLPCILFSRRLIAHSFA